MIISVKLYVKYSSSVSNEAILLHNNNHEISEKSLKNTFQISMHSNILACSNHQTHIHNYVFVTRRKGLNICRSKAHTVTNYNQLLLPKEYFFNTQLYYTGFKNMTITITKQKHI